MNFNSCQLVGGTAEDRSCSPRLFVSTGFQVILRIQTTGPQNHQLTNGWGKSYESRLTSSVSGEPASGFLFQESNEEAMQRLMKGKGNKGQGPTLGRDKTGD